MVKTMSKKQIESSNAEQGIPLAPSEKDRKPWYSDKSHERNRDIDGDKKYVSYRRLTRLIADLDYRLRDQARKSAHDPLTSINQQLVRISSDSHSTSSRPKNRRDAPQPRGGEGSQPQVAERLSRESSERQRALALIARKKREMEGSATPSTVYGGMDGGYGDQYNRREVEEAHRYRDSYAREDGRRGGGHRW